MISANLAYAALVVTDVEATATALARDFGLPRTDCARPGGHLTPVFAVGTSALALFAPTDPYVGDQAKPGVHHIALEVPDLESAVRRAATAGIAAVGAGPAPGLQSTRRWLLDPQATCRVRTYLAEPLKLDRTGGGWVERIDHLGVASADNREAVRTFVGRLGCPLESTQTDYEVQIGVESFTSDKYGVVYHTRPPQPVGGLRVAFCRGVGLTTTEDPREAAGDSLGETGWANESREVMILIRVSRGVKACDRAGAWDAWRCAMCDAWPAA